MCVIAGRGMVSQLSSEGGTVLAGICSVLCSGIVSCGTQQEPSLWVNLHVEHAFYLPDSEEQ
jgi:hypothetical protein